MFIDDFSELQNGSDIRGISLTDVPGEHLNLTDLEAERIGAAFLLWLSEKENKAPQDLKIAIGRDPRVSGQMLLHGLTFGIGPYCPNILDCGLASTPAMFMSTIFHGFDCDGAIMITASHLPMNRNGFKFFTNNGGLNKEDIKLILDYSGGEFPLKKLGEPTEKQIKILGKASYPKQTADLMNLYSAFLRNKIKEGVGNYGKPLKGLKIVVDAGNGSGGFYARNVLAPLGADISGSVYLDADGTFPNHLPNPENADVMQDLCLQVVSTCADFGLIFDTDVDRAAAVDGTGHEISRNGIVALAAALIADEYPGSTVVTDSVTSDHLTNFLIKDLGLKHLRYKRGYRNVINKSIELNNQGDNSALAIETSGNAALRENYFLDDGAYLATKIVIQAAKLAERGKTLADLISNLKSAKESKEYRIPITSKDYKNYGDDVLEALGIWVKEKSDGLSLVTPNYEGIRISFDETHGNGWCLLRKSLHEPLMPLNIESDTQGGIETILTCLKDFLKTREGLNVSAVYK